MGNLINYIGVLFRKGPKYIVDRTHVMELEAGRYRELLIDQPYYWLFERVKPDTGLLDIGANIGDTALYFAMNPNVKHIYSHEPQDYAYNMAKAAIARSRFRDRITLVHDYVTKDNLQSIIDGAGPNVMIKCDIDGPEYEVFTEAMDLSRVYALTIVCHVWAKEGLSTTKLDRLEAIIKSKGFKVKREKEDRSALDDGAYGPGSNYECMLLGWR